MRTVFLVLVLCCAAFAAETKPLPRAHSHNDYEHARPLLDALDHGFGSVEADIHLVNGALLVAHDPEDTRTENTLERLYLAPLAERARKHGGRVYRNGGSLILLIDIKTEAETTYTELKRVLARYETILTRFRQGKIETNAVTVILSGNRPRAKLMDETDRFAAFDGRLADLAQGLTVSFMPLVSDNWRSHFTWKGEGEISQQEQIKLRELVTRAHREGRKLRFWATPDTERAWGILRDAGVDLLNTDDLEGLAAFLRSEPSADR